MPTTKPRLKLEAPRVQSAMTSVLALFSAGATRREAVRFLAAELEVTERHALRLAEVATVVHRDRLRNSADPATVAALDRLRGVKDAA